MADQNGTKPTGAGVTLTTRQTASLNRIRSVSSSADARRLDDAELKYLMAQVAEDLNVRTALGWGNDRLPTFYSVDGALKSAGLPDQRVATLFEQLMNADPEADTCQGTFENAQWRT